MEQPVTCRLHWGKHYRLWQGLANPQTTPAKQTQHGTKWDFLMRERQQLRRGTTPRVVDFHSSLAPLLLGFSINGYPSDTQIQLQGSAWALWTTLLYFTSDRCDSIIISKQIRATDVRRTVTAFQTRSALPVRGVSKDLRGSSSSFQNNGNSCEKL